jgi:predicted nucleic acid-binding protein
MPVKFLDTNILLRYLTADDPAKARRALALLLRLERGEEQAVTSSMVIFETVFTLQSYYRLARTDIRTRLRPIILMRGLRLSNKRLYIRALDLYVAFSFLSFADAFNAASMQVRGVSEIYSWDEGFDRLPGITRVEPEEPSNEDDSTTA